MRILLDTHIYLWWLQDHPKLSNACKAKIVAADDVFISSASIWEAAIKAGLGKLDVNIDMLVAEIANNGFTHLPVMASHAAQVVRLPDIHRDPFDRILIAQAIVEPMRFITADGILKNYSELVQVFA